MSKTTGVIDSLHGGGKVLLGYTADSKQNTKPNRAQVDVSELPLEGEVLDPSDRMTSFTCGCADFLPQPRFVVLENLGHTLPVFVPLSQGFVPPPLHWTQVSVDLSKPPLVEGEVPTPYYEADQKMRKMMLGDGCHQIITAGTSICVYSSNPPQAVVPSKFLGQVMVGSTAATREDDLTARSDTWTADTVYPDDQSEKSCNAVVAETNITEEAIRDDWSSSSSPHDLPLVGEVLPQAPFLLSKL